MKCPKCGLDIKSSEPITWQGIKMVACGLIPDGYFVVDANIEDCPREKLIALKELEERLKRGDSNLLTL